MTGRQLEEAVRARSPALDPGRETTLLLPGRCTKTKNSSVTTPLLLYQIQLAAVGVRSSSVAAVAALMQLLQLCCRGAGVPLHSPSQVYGIGAGEFLYFLVPQHIHPHPRPPPLSPSLTFSLCRIILEFCRTSATLPYRAAFSKHFKDIFQTFSEHCMHL